MAQRRNRKNTGMRYSLRSRTLNKKNGMKVAESISTNASEKQNERSRSTTSTDAGSSTQTGTENDFKRFTRSSAKSENITSLRRSLRICPGGSQSNERVPKKRIHDTAIGCEPALKKLALDKCNRSQNVSENCLSTKSNNERRKCSKYYANKPKSVQSTTTAKYRNFNKLTINRLPVEILGNIFKYLPLHDRKRTRLVCKLWYDNCQNEKLRITGKTKDETMMDIRRCLENCNYERLNLCFDGVSVGKLPIMLWRKVGYKVQSLECQLGAKTMKNIITCCNNLKRLYLRVCLKQQDEAYGALTTLEHFVNVNKIKGNLQTLEINVSDEVMHLSNNDNEIWRRIFEAIYRIFPNVTTFAFSRYHFRNDGSIKYKCHFTQTKSTFNETENSSPAPVFANLAFSIFSSDVWVSSLDDLSVLRLSTLELKFCKKTYTPEDGVHLRNFFANQKQLKSVRLDFSSWVGTEMLRSVLFVIVENCRDLIELSYVSPFHKHYLTSVECTALLHKMEHVNCISIGGFGVTHTPLFSIPSSTFKVSRLELSNVDEKICLCFIRSYTRLQHLTIKKLISDDVLQCIFQYLTDLRTLDVRLDSSCTNFGITGVRSDSDPIRIPGYSISGLQKLEYLAINFVKATQINNSVLNEFRFPNLRYLNCAKESVKFRQAVEIVRRSPLLNKIEFLGLEMSLDSVLKFCKSLGPKPDTKRTYKRKLKRLVDTLGQ